jgi:TetR/AcrR family acrAB operon transcriptional repressor
MARDADAVALKAAPARPRRMAEIGEESRRLILNAAEELFSERGFDRTSLAEVAARAGISRGSIPWHFDNKDGLLIAVVERMIERHMGKSMQPLEAIARDWAQLVKSRPPGVLFTLMSEAMHTDGLVHEKFLDFFRTQRHLLAQWVVIERSAGTTKSPDVRAMAAIINATFLGLQLQWGLDPERVDLDRSLQLFTQMVESFLDQALDFDVQKTKPRPSRVKA